MFGVGLMQLGVWKYFRTPICIICSIVALQMLCLKKKKILNFSFRFYPKDNRRSFFYKLVTLTIRIAMFKCICVLILLLYICIYHFYFYLTMYICAIYPIYVGQQLMSQSFLFESYPTINQIYLILSFYLIMILFIFVSY